METNDRDEPKLKEIKDNGQQAAYLVLSEEERKKGFVRPVRRTYFHKKCGVATSMSQGIAETYARNPAFYGSTYCCGSKCSTHFQLRNPDGSHNFEWDDGTPVGS